MSSSIKPFSGVWAFLFFILMPQAAAQAAGSILVWPIDPVIENDQRAVALWIENCGSRPSLLQLRIFAWSQEDGEDRYADQEDIIGTPPMIQIDAGKRQMLRLTRTNPTPAGMERAFRVVIDEVPTPAASETPESPSAGVKFQFRYSIPLFVYGEGLRGKAGPDRQRVPERIGEPDLSWRIISRNGQRSLEIRNEGTVHARLTGAHFKRGGAETILAQGLYGYVLAGKSIFRPVPEGGEGTATLSATVNGSPQVLVIPARE